MKEINLKVSSPEKKERKRSHGACTMTLFIDNNSDHEPVVFRQFRCDRADQTQTLSHFPVAPLCLLTHL